MTGNPEERRSYLSYLHLKEIEIVLNDLVTFIDRQITVNNLCAKPGSEVADDLKKKFVVSTFELTGDLSYEDESTKKIIKVGDGDKKFIMAFSLDVAISFSASMLGLRDEVAMGYINDEQYDGDIQDATKEIFNLSNGSIEKTLRRVLEMDINCKLLTTELVDFSELPLPDLGSPLDIFFQCINIGELKNGTILQIIPENLGNFLHSFMAQVLEVTDVNSFVSQNNSGIEAGHDSKTKGSTKEIKRVMVVDDTYLIRQLITEYLRDYGYAVSERANGVSAVKRAYLMGESLKLIILDLKLPDLSGFRVLEELKKNERTKHIKIIVCSSISDKVDVVKCFKLGAMDYIVKPFNRETIVGKIVKAIGRP